MAGTARSHPVTMLDRGRSPTVQGVRLTCRVATGLGARTSSGRRREHDGSAVARPTSRRVSTETKAAFKTTEFIAFVAVLAGVLIAALIVDEANAGGYGAKQAWLYATILTTGYMISRGLAKSGSREPFDDDND